MALFGPTKKVRRPVAEIVSGLSTMVTELEDSKLMATEEKAAAEKAIVELNAQRKLLSNEEAQAGAIVQNLRSLLGLDLDGDGEADDLDRAIAAITAAPADVDEGDSEA